MVDKSGRDEVLYLNINDICRGGIFRNESKFLLNLWTICECVSLVRVNKLLCYLPGRTKWLARTLQGMRYHPTAGKPVPAAGNKSLTTPLEILLYAIYDYGTHNE